MLTSRIMAVADDIFELTELISEGKNPWCKTAMEACIQDKARDLDILIAANQTLEDGGTPWFDWVMEFCLDIEDCMAEAFENNPPGAPASAMAALIHKELDALEIWTRIGFPLGEIRSIEKMTKQLLLIAARQRKYPQIERRSYVSYSAGSTPEAVGDHQDQAQGGG